MLNRIRLIKYLLRGLGLAVVLAVPQPEAANAAIATANLSVTATVGTNCSISTTALAFGAYDPVSTNASTPLDATGGVLVTCTNGTTGTVTLGQGSNAAGGSNDSSPLRRLRDGGTNYLSYTLYQDAGHATVWGNTPATGIVHNGTGSQATITVHGRIAAAQNVPSGTYTDTVVATVTF